MNVLEISNVSKSFGTHSIIKDLNLVVPEHCVYGFIGQNGAGKTTTMKMILGLLKPDGGEIRVMGQKVEDGNNTNAYIGYLPDVPEFYGYMTPREYLMFCGKLSGMNKDELAARIDELLCMVGLDKHKKRIKGFSRGMKQRLGVAQALLSKPKLLICDEPTSALDPLGRKELLDILMSVRDEITVLFSTHILSDVEKICDRIAFLHNGVVVIDGTLEELKQARKGQGVVVAFDSGKDMEAFAKAFPDGEMGAGYELMYKSRTEADMLAFMKFLVDKSITARRLEMLEPTLEDLYINTINE